MTDVKFSVSTSFKKKPGRTARKRFGIVHYVTGARQSYLVVPANSGISPGDRISYYVEDGGISFRVETEGRYAVFTPTPTSTSLRCTLCPELENFAHHRLRDIVTRTVPGGWFVPLDQFD